MKLLILGAGASWGSSNVGKLPLLTKHLLSVLRPNFPKSWGLISDQYAKAHDMDFERIMDAMLDRQDPAEARFMNRELAYYFEHFVPDDQSLYMRLLNEVDLSNVVICTLNYDLLLQRAGERCGKRFYVTGFEFDGDGQPLPRDASSIELLMPHGSAGLVDMGYAMEDCMVSGGSLTDIGQATYQTRLCLHQKELLRYYKANELNPIMSFIRRGKNTLIGDSLLKTARDRFADVCIKANGIAVVGMQLNIRDKHITLPLIYSRAPVLIAVARPALWDVFSWGALGSRLTDTGKTWLEAFDTIKEFLRRR